MRILKAGAAIVGAAVLSAFLSVEEPRAGYFEAAEGVFACGFCVDCATNSGAGHAFMTGSGSTAIREGDMHACIATDCVSSVHPTCGGSQQDDDASGEASDIDLYAGRIAQGDSRALSELFRAFPSRVRVNLAREAVQVVSDCSDDAILVHVPLNAEQLKVAQRIAFGLATE